MLLDDNFASIVAAVREGRRIFENIRKFVRYAITGNSAETWTLVLAPMVFTVLTLSWNPIVARATQLKPSQPSTTCPYRDHAQTLRPTRKPARSFPGPTRRQASCLRPTYAARMA